LENPALLRGLREKTSDAKGRSIEGLRSLRRKLAKRRTGGVGYADLAMGEHEVRPIKDGGKRNLARGPRVTLLFTPRGGRVTGEIQASATVCAPSWHGLLPPQAVRRD
jgi:hypothetical protein